MTTDHTRAIVGLGVPLADASDLISPGSVTIADAGSLITATTIEDALQEIYKRTRLHVSLGTGANESSSDITITGMTATSTILQVMVLATAASIATIAARAAGDFTPGAAKMTSAAHEANNTGNQYLVFWLDT